jgi:hypothetical protein
VAKTDQVLIGAVLAFLLAGGLCLCCLGAVVFLPLRWFGSTSGPFGAAKEFIRKDPAVAEHLGRNLDFNMVPSGSVNENNGVGQATLRFDVKGSKGHGVVFVELEKPKGKDWVVVNAKLEMGAETFPLRGNPGEAKPLPEEGPLENAPAAPEEKPRSGESVNA